MDNARKPAAPDAPTVPPFVGSFRSASWGRVDVWAAHYGSADGPLAITLTLDDGETLDKLSVNMYRPHCTADSRDLPADCFFVKSWAENELLIDEVRASGLFIERPDLGTASSGHVEAAVWQVRPQEREAVPA